jgi:hypothetical protein
MHIDNPDVKSSHFDSAMRFIQKTREVCEEIKEAIGKNLTAEKQKGRLEVDVALVELTEFAQIKSQDELESNHDKFDSVLRLLRLIESHDVLEAPLAAKVKALLSSANDPQESPWMSTLSELTEFGMLDTGTQHFNRSHELLTQQSKEIGNKLLDQVSLSNDALKLISKTVEELLSIDELAIERAQIPSLVEGRNESIATITKALNQIFRDDQDRVYVRERLNSKYLYSEDEVSEDGLWAVFSAPETWIEVIEPRMHSILQMEKVETRGDLEKVAVVIDDTFTLLTSFYVSLGASPALERQELTELSQDLQDKTLQLFTGLAAKLPIGLSQLNAFSFNIEME